MRTLDEIAPSWLHGKSPRTQESYLIAARALMRSASASDVRLIRLDDLQAWDREMEVAGLAASSRRTKLAAARSLLAFCVSQGVTERNVAGALTVPKARDALTERILSEEELGRLIRAASGGPNAERDAFLVRLLYGAALRVSELCSICWRDVVETGADPNGDPRGQVIVFGKGSKTGIVPLQGALFAELLIRRTRALESGAAGDRVCPLSRQRLWQIVRRASDRAGLGKPVSPHWCRHAHASHALQRGADIALIQRTLRHANVATTSRYLHARAEQGSSSYLADL